MLNKNRNRGIPNVRAIVFAVVAGGPLPRVGLDELVRRHGVSVRAKMTAAFFRISFAALSALFSLRRWAGLCGLPRFLHPSPQHALVDAKIHGDLAYELLASFGQRHRLGLEFASVHAALCSLLLHLFLALLL